MSAGQIAGGVVGGGIGFLVGGPAGAAVGFGLGLGLGSMAGGGQKGAKPNINTDPGQTSTYGAFITRTHGTIGQSGNIIWLEGNKLKAVVKKAKKSGKGGGAPAGAATVSYFATFAVGLCEGPIAGVRRIWIGPDLIYDAGSDDLETIISSNKRLSGFKVYLGADTQAPDTRIQADRGAANTPSYAGLAYIVIKDLALKSYGDSIAGAQIKVEVVNSQTVSGAVKKYPTATMLNTLGNLQNAPYMDAAGLHIWSLSDSGTTPTASRYIMGFDGVIRLIGSRQITLPYGLPNSYADMPNGQGDSNFLGYPLKVGNSGITLVDSNYVVRSFQHATPSVGASAYCVDGGFVYFAGANGFVAPTFSRANISTGAVVNIPLTAPTATGLVDTVGIVGGTICIGYKNNSAGSAAYLFFFDINTLEPLASLPLSSFLGGSNYMRTEFSGGSMYVSNTFGDTYRFEAYLSAPVYVGNLTPEFTPGSSAYHFRLHSFGGTYTQWLSYYNTAGKAAIFTSNIIAAQSVPLSTVVAAEAVRSALIKPADIDVTGLAGSVIGYRVTSSGSIRNALEPLRAAYPFDVFQSGYKIKFRSRGTASVATIPIGDLAADMQLEESREMDSQLPSRVSVQYLDRNRDYDQNEQEDARLGATDGDTQEVSIQVVMTGEQAKQVAEKLLALAWLERTAFSFKLPPIYSRIEAADTITMVAEYAIYELILGSVSHDSDGMLSCSGVPSNASLYTSSTPADEGQQPPVTIPLQGSTYGVLIDCPVIDETLQNSPGFIVGLDGYSGGWSGGSLLRSADSGQTWADVQAFNGRATIGFASTVLGAHSGGLIQRGGSLTVSASNLEGVTEAQMLGGSNIAAYGAPGRWEVIRFQNATLNGDGTYALDTFWRGDKGTEWATGLHVAGDTFVLLTDPDLAFVGMATESIGLPRDYRMVTFDADIDSATSQSFTYAGANLECLSPVYAKGVRVSGDLAVTWTRRSRLGSSWWTNGVVAPIGETTEAYEVDVMQGATVNRTLSSVTPAITYTSAQQVTDFGSAQASITLRIYQLSTAVGRGLPMEVTL